MEAEHHSKEVSMARRHAFASMDEEDVAQKAREIEERYRDYGRQVHLDLDSEERSDIAQQSFLPSVIDPKLWLIPCKVSSLKWEGRKKQTKKLIILFILFIFFR